MRVFWCVLLAWACRVIPARGLLLFANVRAWDAVSSAGGAAEPPLTQGELEQRFAEVWGELRGSCQGLPALPEGVVDVGFDDRLLTAPSLARVLGWASRTERLVERRWQGMLSTQERLDWMLRDGYAHLGTLRVARAPPGGWFRGPARACRDRFRLEDVLLHEALHLLGVSSTVRAAADAQLAVGMDYAGVCYPGEFDAQITSRNGSFVVGAHCGFTPTADNQYFVRGVRLYVPAGPFSPGTTMSHVHDGAAVLSPHVGACAAHGAASLTTADAAVLGAVGVTCSVTAAAEAGGAAITAADYGAPGQAAGDLGTAQTPHEPALPSGSALPQTDSRSRWTAATLLWSCCAAVLAAR